MFSPMLGGSIMKTKSVGQIILAGLAISGIASTTLAATQSIHQDQVESRAKWFINAGTDQPIAGVEQVSKTSESSENSESSETTENSEDSESSEDSENDEYSPMDQQMSSIISLSDHWGA
jgi:hypothetical protein